MNTLVKSESYQLLCEQIKACVVEAVTQSHWLLIEGYWNVGKLIREEFGVEKWTQNAAGEVLPALAEDTGISTRTLYRCLACFDQYPDLNTIPGGKAITWNKLITQYLPGVIGEKKPLETTCPRCGFTYPYSREKRKIYV